MILVRSRSRVEFLHELLYIYIKKFLARRANMAVSSRTRMQVAKADILRIFEGQNKKIFTPSEISEILTVSRSSWRLTESTTLRQFISFLSEQGKLEEVRLDFPSLRVQRYIWGTVGVYEFASLINPKAYFTHYSALYFHSLTEQIPKTIYVNLEQPYRPSHNRSSLEQGRIDFAFKRAPRVSKAVTQLWNYTICLLHGMSTGQLGVSVTESDLFKGPPLKVTDVERTLIDIAVRPFYAGGVFEVLGAYRLAKDKVSINKLASYLKKMDFIYPYHQAIGFYLEKSGVYDDSQMNLLRKFDIKFDFYLTYQMKDVSYSKEWRLYYPKGL
jgi:predicted transcriptional regulator of viral defense system